MSSKHEDGSWDPHNPHKKVMAVCGCNWRVETRPFLGLAGQPVWLICEFRFIVRHPVSKNKVKMNRRKHSMSTFGLHTCTHRKGTPAHTHTQVHVHLHCEST